MSKVSHCVGALALLVLTNAAAANAQVAGVDFGALKGRPNLDQTPVGSSGHWSLEKLLALDQAELERLWSKLPAATLQEMNGHFLGLQPAATDTEFQKQSAAFLFDEKSPRGYWLGKVFHPLTASTGEGYNMWRFPGGRIERSGRFSNRIDSSLIDGKPSYFLDYSTFNDTTLVDELRKLDDYILIGAATEAAGEGKRSRVEYFVLTGPIDEWVAP